MKKLTVVFAVLVSGFVNAQTTEEIDQYDTSKYEIIYTNVNSVIDRCIESIYILRI